MPRNFSGSNTSVTTSIGALTGCADGAAFAVLCRRATTAGFHGLFGVYDSGVDTALSLEFDANLTTFIVTTNANDRQITFGAGSFPADKWLLIVGTTAGNSNPWVIMRLDVESGTWLDASSSNETGMANTVQSAVLHGQWTDPAGGNINDDYVGDIAWTAIWTGARPGAFDSVAKAEAFFEGASVAQILGMNPSAMWVFDQALTTDKLFDLTGGGANETAISGTTVSTNNAPYSYGASPTYAAKIAGASVTVLSVAATADAASGVPAITAARVVAIAAVAATADVAAGAPTIQIAATIPAVLAEAPAEALTPAITAQVQASIAAVAATADAAASTPTIITAVSRELEGYRWRMDDGTEVTATWAASQDTAINVPIDTTRRLRVIVNYTGDPPSESPKLQHRPQGVGPWIDVL